MRLISLLLLIFVFSRGSAFATPITADGTWYEFQFDAGGAATGCAVGCVATANPVASLAPAPPWTFSGAATVTVLDLFLSGDTFELFDNLISLGVSSTPTGGGSCGNDITCSLGDASYSRLIADLGAGAHSLTIVNIASATTGGGAAVFRVSQPVTVPEPATTLLLGGGLTVLAARAHRRRRVNGGASSGVRAGASARMTPHDYNPRQRGTRDG